MNKILEDKIKKEWDISYDPYSDLFQIYDSSIFELSKKHIITNKKNNVKLLFYKNYSSPVLIEIMNAYTELGQNIENLNKNDILKLIEED